VEVEDNIGLALVAVVEVVEKSGEERIAVEELRSVIRIAFVLMSIQLTTIPWSRRCFAEISHMLTYGRRVLTRIGIRHGNYKESKTNTFLRV